MPVEQIAGQYQATPKTFGDGETILIQTDAFGNILTAPAVSPGGLTPTTGGLLTGTVTIASGGSLSTAIDLGSSALVGINMPAAWTTASLSFAFSDASGGTYVPVTNENGEIVYPTSAAAASQFIGVWPGYVLGIRYLKIRSGPSTLPVNQAADRTITIFALPK